MQGVNSEVQSDITHSNNRPWAPLKKSMVPNSRPHWPPATLDLSVIFSHDSQDRKNEPRSKGRLTLAAWGCIRSRSGPTTSFLPEAELTPYPCPPKAFAEATNTTSVV